MARGLRIEARPFRGREAVLRYVVRGPEPEGIIANIILSTAAVTDDIDDVDLVTLLYEI
jgi:hypothetical protein